MLSYLMAILIVGAILVAPKMIHYCYSDEANSATRFNIYVFLELLLIGTTIHLSTIL